MPCEDWLLYRNETIVRLFFESAKLFAGMKAFLKSKVCRTLYESGGHFRKVSLLNSTNTVSILPKSAKSEYSLHRIAAQTGNAACKIATLLAK